MGEQRVKFFIQEISFERLLLRTLLGSDKKLYLKINEGIFLHFEIHYLKFVCKIISPNYSHFFLCLVINLSINFKLVSDFDLFAF